MGKILVQFSIKNMSQSQYDMITSGLEAAGKGTIPERLFHVAAPMEDGWHVTDVWESQEAFDRFAETMLPIMASTGTEPVPPVVLQVHNILVP